MNLGYEIILVLFFLILIALIFMIPMVMLVFIEKRFGGPRYPLHLAINLLFVGLVVTTVIRDSGYAHAPPSYLFLLPGFLGFGFFYKYICPRLVVNANPKFLQFRSWAANINLAITALLSLMVISSILNR